MANGPTCEPPEEEEHTSDNDENPEEDWLAKDRGAESEVENEEQQAEHQDGTQSELEKEDDDDNAEQGKRRIKPICTPYSPSEKEKEEHEICHIPY